MRGLVVDRVIDESQFSVLKSHIDELRKGLRLGTVEARLKFLPYGMVLHLQRLLADARIDEFERDHFMAALDGEASLTKRQKVEVRKVIDGWFARDAAVAP